MSWADPDFSPHYSVVPPADASSGQIQKGFVFTKESFVDVGGVKYRQIEYEGKFFLVDLRQPADFYHCRDSAFVESSAAEADIKVTKRTSLFMEGLIQKCDRSQDLVTTATDLGNGKVGVKFKGDKPNSTEQKVYVNPLMKTLGGSTTF